MSNKTFVISLLILLTTVALVSAVASRGQPVIVKTNLENLPMEIAGFKATEDNFPERVYEELDADIHVFRHYRSDDGHQVDLYIGYYGTAKGGRTRHNPYACLSGAGWGIVETHKAALNPVRYSNEVEVNYILAQKGDVYESVLHWYQSAGDQVVSSGLKQNIQRFKGRVLKNRYDGAFIRVSTYTDQAGTEQAMVLTTFFAELVVVLLPEYWPIEE